MKPIIIYTKADGDSDICISKSEFEKAISDAYEQGKADAQPYHAIWTTQQPEYIPRISDTTAYPPPFEFTTITSGSRDDIKF